MALPSSINPLRYIIQRQYKDNIIKNKFFSERFAKARNLYRKDLLAHYGCVNAIEFSEDGEFLISGGDDKRVLLWSIARAIYDHGNPISMRTNHGSNIFCLTFDSQNEMIFSGGNDDQVLIHEVYTRNLKMAIPHEKPIYGISIHPQNNNILSTAGDDGRVLLFDIRESPFQEAQVVAQQISSFHSVTFSPTNPKYLVTAHSEEGIALWDVRKPKSKLIHYYDSQTGKVSGISACFDSGGKRVLALRRRLPPVLYATESEGAMCQFYHPQYYNSCTMKTCCFAGDNDNYILSGSDDFNLYMWEIPKDDSEWGSPHIVLRGHRSIVNQVRYNKHNHLIASSGVEKMVKLWSAISVGNWKGSILKEHVDATRSIYTHEDYISLVGTSERINHDYSDQSTNEDSKMMAFFDSLIQREIEGWDTSSDESFKSQSDSEDDQDWSKVITKIFRNGDESKKNKTNRITQLISKRKNRLAKLAHNKSVSYVQRKFAEKKRRILFLKSSPLTSRKNRIFKKSYKNSTPECNSRKKESKTPKYHIRQSSQNSTEQRSTLDTPSTSTGITSSKNDIYRVIEQDSDDEPRNESLQEDDNIEGNNFISILPTPFNGTRDVFINVLEVENDSSGLDRNPSAANEDYNSGHENIVPLDGVSVPSTSNAYDPVQTNIVKCDFQDGDLSNSSSDSDFEYTYTPKKRCVSASDSGCATGPNSSASSCSTKHSKLHKACSNSSRLSGDEYMENFRKRVRKVRMNIRRNISADSDSN